MGGKAFSLMEASFLRWEKKNQSRLRWLLAISGCWSWLILLKAQDKHALESHHYSQQHQLVFCVTYDCIGKSVK